MALLSDYAAGTITIAANATAVTGTGTAWLAAGFAQGDLLIANGYFGLVGSVESNTALTLAQPWRGGPLSGAAYRLRYQGDGSRISAQARQLIELIGGSGNIEALGALAAVADRLAYFTGAGQMSTTALTAFARTLLDDANASTALTTLGAFPAAGGTLTGDVTITKTFPSIALNHTGVARWSQYANNDGTLRLGYTPSGGSTVNPFSFGGSGSIYSIQFGDLNTALAGKFSTGGGTISGAVTVSGALTAAGGLTVGSTAVVGTNGDIAGSIWNAWGAGNAFAAISARIEARISDRTVGVSAASGYVTLPNGLIIQWGLGNTSSGANTYITFPVSFPTAAYAVVAVNTTVIPDNAAFYGVSTDTLGRSSFFVRGRVLGNGGIVQAGQLNFYYIAIGR